MLGSGISVSRREAYCSSEPEVPRRCRVHAGAGEQAGGVGALADGLGFGQPVADMGETGKGNFGISGDQYGKIRRIGQGQDVILEAALAQGGLDRLPNQPGEIIP
jgi:hypothetical protein